MQHVLAHFLLKILESRFFFKLYFRISMKIFALAVMENTADKTQDQAGDMAGLEL